MLKRDTQLELFEKNDEKPKFKSVFDHKYKSLEEKAQEGYFKWQDYYRTRYHDYDKYYQPYRKEYNTCHCGLDIEITYDPIMEELARAFDPARDMSNSGIIHEIKDQYHCPHCGLLWYMVNVKILRVEGKYRGLRGKGIDGST